MACVPVNQEDSTRLNYRGNLTKTGMKFRKWNGKKCSSLTKKSQKMSVRTCKEIIKPGVEGLFSFP